VTTTTTYPHAGIRSVTLTVTDAEGASNSITKSFEPSVNTDAAPVARFTASCNGTVCTLDAAASTDDVGITKYAWSLGKSPGNSATGITVTTDYWHTSTRTVTLTVTDTKGQTNSVTKTVNVP
jgi:PKD repeat protein